MTAVNLAALIFRGTNAIEESLGLADEHEVDRLNGQRRGLDALVDTPADGVTPVNDPQAVSASSNRRQAE